MKTFKTLWTPGTYNKESNTALMYNILKGMAYYFENESAEVINEILKIKPNEEISLEKLSDDLIIDIDCIKEFFIELINNGLITKKLYSKKKIHEIRKRIGHHRRKKIKQQRLSIKKKLPFVQEDAEYSFMSDLEKFNKPFSASIELTYRCNERCVHCYNPGATRNFIENSARNYDKLNLNDYSKLLRDLKILGVTKIILTGGEPLLNKYFWDIVETVYYFGFAFDIYTNGLLLLGKEKLLASYYPKIVGLSVYSAIDEVHDRITGVKGSLKKTLECAHNLSGIGIPLFFKCPIMIYNCKIYPSVVELAKKYGAVPQIDLSLSNSLDGDVSIQQYLMPSNDIIKIILRDSNIPLYIGKEIPNWGKMKKDLNSPPCGAGINSINITPDGYLTPCLSFPTQFGNIKNKSVIDIWNSSKELKKWQNSVLNDFDECGTNNRCSYCNRCPGMSFIEHGTPFKSSTLNCNLAKLRMKVSKDLKKGIDPINNQTVIEMLKKTNLKEPKNITKMKAINFRNKNIF